MSRLEPTGFQVFASRDARGPWPVRGRREPDCNWTRLDETTGLPTTSDVVKWFCDEHAHLAAEGDMDPRLAPHRVNEFGVFVPVDVYEQERDTAREESRRFVQQSAQAERDVEAAHMRQHEEARRGLGRPGWTSHQGLG